MQQEQQSQSQHNERQSQQQDATSYDTDTLSQMTRLGDVSFLPAPLMQQMRVMRDQRKDYEVSRIVPSHKVERKFCPICKMEIRDGEINWTRDGYDMLSKKTLLSPCPACSKDAYRRMEAKKQAEQVAHIFGGAQVPYRAAQWDFTTYPEDADTEALALVQAFVERHLYGDKRGKRILYLGGATGRCKTGLAISALKVALQAGESGLFILSIELMNKLRATYSPSRIEHVTEDDMLAAVTSVQWLVLDDLAVEKPSEYVLRQLYLIIQKRADKGLYTIITSNLSLKDLEKYWRPDNVAEAQFHPGVRIVERIREYAEGCAVKGRNQRA